MKYAEAVFYSVEVVPLSITLLAWTTRQRQCRVLQLHHDHRPKWFLLEDKTGIAVIFRKTSNDIYFYGGRNKIVKNVKLMKNFWISKSLDNFIVLLIVLEV